MPKFDVVEFPQYIAACEKAGLTADERDYILDTLQDNPEKGEVIPGSGGARKARFGLKARGKGTRGGVRVITFVITKRSEVLLLDLYSKGEKDDLTPKELKALKEVTDLISAEVKKKR